MKRLLFPILCGVALFLTPIYVDEEKYFSHPDKVLHFAGGMIAAWFFLRLLFPQTFYLNSFKLIIVLVSCTCFAGVLWELLEFIAPHYRNEFILFKFMPGGGGLEDTLGDLVADMSGALLFSTLYVFFRKAS